MESPEPDCDPIADVNSPADRSRRQHRGYKLIRGVEQESAVPARFLERRHGLMRLMPATVEQFKVGDVFDPQQNIGRRRVSAPLIR
jgi:hypothetical protein